MNPSVSIVLPTYNRAHIISKAIDSVLNQTYCDFELIIVDDCSTDNTKSLIDNYEDERIHYVRCPENMGAAGARNFGATFSNAPYLAFQDSDTVWTKEKLEKQLEYLYKNPTFSLCFHPYYQIEHDKKKIEPNPDSLNTLSPHIFFDLLTSPMIGTPTILMKTDVFRSVCGFLATLKSHEDYEFSLRVAKDFKIGFLKEPMLYSYHPDEGINFNYHEILRTNFYILNLYHDIIAQNPPIENRQLERLFYYTILGNEGQYFFDELAQYALATGHKNLYYDYEKTYNNIREQLANE